MKDHEQEQQGGDRLWKWEVGCLERAMGEIIGTTVKHKNKNIY